MKTVFVLSVVFKYQALNFKKEAVYFILEILGITEDFSIFGLKFEKGEIKEDQVENLKNEII